ncbi:MAG: SDR family oxidoreductase [Patescibacteria group bacterium]
MMNLSGKIVLVIGASQGLGKEMVNLLVKENVKVFALARSIQDSDLPSSVIKISVDIIDTKSIASAFEQIDKETQRIDILINCVGQGLIKPFESVTQAEIIETLSLNLQGNILMAQEGYKRMLRHKSGHIVNIISTSGIKGKASETIYCASKWGLRGFSEALRQEARKKGIRVSAIFPGGMQTENFWKISPEVDTKDFIKPKLVAEQIVHLLKTDPSISPSELILERM